MRHHSFRFLMHLCSRATVTRLLLLVSWLAGCSAASGQTLVWKLVADGREVAWPSARAWPVDSLHQAAGDALQSLRRSGHLFARIDSHAVAEASAVRLFVSPGPTVRVACVNLAGATALDSLKLKAQLVSRPGNRLMVDTLEADIEGLLETYSAAGYPFAEISIRALGALEDSCLSLDIVEGPMPGLARVELDGATRTRSPFAARIARLRPGRPLGEFVPEEIRNRLQEAGIFRRVDLPRLAIDADSGAVVQIPVEEGPPGAFDLALGYEPSRDGASRGRLVGAGHLLLRNLFGGGRQFALELRRPPGRVSRFNVRTSDPYAFGFPVALAATFDGLQQDSTYAKRGYALEVGYRVAGRLHVFGTLTKEVTRPGLAGQEITDDRQRIASASATFIGAGARLSRLDRRVNPRRGLVVETNFERGRKKRSHHVVRADTALATSILRQDRLRARIRLYRPATRRQVVVLGGETYLLRSDEMDESDLFRFGGATTLRGYDEERFRVPFAARLLAEYRYLVDSTSYGGVFFDLGFVDERHIRGFHPGFGLGFQIGTDVGLVNFSVAAATAEPSIVRAHIQLSLGL